MEIEVIDSGEVITIEVVDTALNQVQSDWTQSDNTKPDFIKNKPSVSTQVQSDWNQTDIDEVDYIKNKPTIPTVPENLSDFNNDENFVNDTDLRATGATFTGAIDLSKYFTSYLNYQMVGALALTIASGAIIGGFAEGIIIGDGTNTPTLTGIVEDPNSGGYVATNGTKNRFVCAKFQDAVYITYTQVV